MAQSRSEQVRLSQSGPSHTLQARASQVPQRAQPVARQSLVNDNAGQLSIERHSIRSQSALLASAPDDKREDAGGSLYVPLWDQACTSLRAVQSKHLDILEANLGDVNSNDSLGDRISRLGEAQQATIRSKDGVRPMKWRRWLGRTARAALSMKDVAMGLARLDHHGVAPIVLGGIFTVIQVIQGATDESLTAMIATLEIGCIVSLWNTVEERQIMRNRDPSLTESYEKLSDAIVQLYKDIIVLLGQMVAHFSKSKLRQIFAAIAPAYIEWKNIQAEIKSLETNCNNIKSIIMHKKEDQNLNSEILKSISSYDIRGIFTRVLEGTGIDGPYSARCQWLVEHRNFEEWYSRENISVLWLKGTVGTGKTTLMARAICEVQRSVMINIEAKPLAIFFFQKALNPSSSPLDVETCLRSLVRQLSWSRETAMIRDVVEDFYSDLQNQQTDDSTLTAGECVKLLKALISGVETYIIIDAIDECSDPEALLEKLKELTVLIEDTDEHGPLHLLLCSRDDQAITDYFDDCLMIATSPTQSNEDQSFYIKTEIQRMSTLKPGSLFFSSKKRYPDRLEKILMEKAEGLFRWAQIQIQKFTGRFRDESEIEEEFERLESHTTHPELNKEYARLLNSLGRSGRTRQRAIKMLKLISSSLTPLSVESLAEAITVSEHGLSCEQLKADDVRRILVGFVTEDRSHQPILFRTVVPVGELFVRLAHSSVIEYLADAELSAEDFSRLALHSEAARLCFASLQQGRQGEAPDRSETEGSDCPTNAYGDDFFGYSCNWWPSHCWRAFAEDSTCALVQDASNFILSEGFLVWNRVVREHCKDGHFTIGPFVDPQVIEAHTVLRELVKIPGIWLIVDLQDVNSQATNLPKFPPNLINIYQSYLLCIDKEMGASMGPVGWTAVARHLKSGQDGFAPHGNGLTALHWAVISYCLCSIIPPRLDLMIGMVEYILEQNANTYDVDNFGGSAMHYAYTRKAQDILIKHAKKSEEKGLDGAVQRLLRMGIAHSKTPLDVITNIPTDDIPYLESQLEEATARNEKKVMYDFVGTALRNEAGSIEEWIQRLWQQLQYDHKAMIRAYQRSIASS